MSVISNSLYSSGKTIKGNNTDYAAQPADLSVSEAQTLLNVYPAHPGYLVGNRYPITMGNHAPVAVPAIDTIYFNSFFCPSPITVTKASLWVVTGGAGSSAKIAIWASAPATLLPLGAPLATDNTGTATTSSTANADSSALNITLSPGVLYWFGAKFTGTLPTIWMVSNSNAYPAWFYGSRGNNSTFDLSFADTYSNNMPTFTGASSFTAHAGGSPQVFMVT